MDRAYLVDAQEPKMNEVLRTDLLKNARRLSDIADNIRRVMLETGNQPLLATALTDLIHAEGLILDAAKG